MTLPLSARYFPARLVSKLFAPMAKAKPLAILIFHRVLAQVDPLLSGEPDISTFDWQMNLLARHFNVLPLSDAISHLQSGTLPARAVSITFDDGYADNYENALPVLEKYNLPATFFIATGYLDGGCMWNDRIIESLRRCKDERLDLRGSGLGDYAIVTMQDRVEAIRAIIGPVKYLPLDERESVARGIQEITQTILPSNMMMTRSQVKALHEAGMEIGGHTVNHPILANCDRHAAREEIMEGKRDLETLLGKPVRLFAYPNGKPGQDYTADHAKLLESLGFQAAVSTAWGVATSDTDRFQLPRFTPWDKQPARFLARLLANYRRTNPGMLT